VVSGAAFSGVSSQFAVGEMVEEDVNPKTEERKESTIT
jgi:hypothetical protein